MDIQNYNYLLNKNLKQCAQMSIIVWTVTDLHQLRPHEKTVQVGLFKHAKINWLIYTRQNLQSQGTYGRKDFKSHKGE